MSDERKTAQPNTEPIDADFKPATPKDAAPRPVRNGPGWTMFNVSVVVAAIVGALTALLAPQRGGESGDADVFAEIARIDANEAAGANQAEQLAALIERLSALEAATDALAAPSARETSLRDQIETLSTRVDEIVSADAEDTATSPRLLNRTVLSIEDNVKALADRLSELEAAGDTQPATPVSATGDLEAILAQAASSAETAEAARKRADTSAAIAALAVSANAGTPFPAASDVLQSHFPGNADLTRLEAAAEKGAPTQAQLEAQFDVAATAALAAQTPNASSAATWDWVGTVLGDGAAIRRKDDPQTDLARDLTAAREKLARGDLPGMVDDLQAIKGAPGAALQDYIEDAQRRADLESALARLAMLNLEN